MSLVMAVPAFTVENIEQALHQLYYNPSLELKDAAQQWLTKAQRASEAWQFAWILLQDDKPTEVQYFGASALVSKISKAWIDIPNSEIRVLRNRLFEEILKFSVLQEKRIVLTRLCVAFSSFLANCAVRQLWPNAMQEIFEKFQSDQKPLANSDYFHALLEILTVVAEEFQTNTIEKYKKSLILHLLISGKSQVLHFLSVILSDSALKYLHGSVLKCLSSWILLNIPLTECTDLLLNIFESVKSPTLFEESVECLLNTFSSPSSQDYPNTIKHFMPLVVSLKPLFEKSVNDQDSETILGLTKLSCSLAENFPKLVLETINDPNCGLGMLQMVLHCCCTPLQYPTEECSSPISFTFWCSLQDELETMSDADRNLASQHLNPYFCDLVDCLLIKACYPKDDSFNDWSAEEKEQHRIFRIDISDTLMYLLESLGINLFVHIFKKFQNSVSNTADAPEKHWHVVEVCLFGVHSVIETVLEYNCEIPYLNTLVDMLPMLNVSSFHLADTLLYTIGTLTEWFNSHSGKILPLLSFVIKCLSNQELALSAVLTVRRIMRECCDDLIPFSNEILQHCTGLFISGSLQKDVENWLIQAIGHLLSVLSREVCLSYLEKLLQLHLQQLAALSNDGSSAPNKTAITHILELLGNLFCSLDRYKEVEGEKLLKQMEEEPAVMILVKLNPIIQNILNTWVTDVEIVCKICNMYDQAIRSLVDDFSPVLPQLVEILCGIFHTYPYACVMRITQQLVLVFGRNKSNVVMVSHLLHCVLTVVLPLYHNRKINSYPDTAQGFMCMLEYVIKKRLLLKLAKSNSTTLCDLFNCGILTLQLPENGSVISGASFLVAFINMYQDPEVAQVINEYIKELFLICLQAVGGASPRTNIDRFSDVLLAVGQANFDLFSKTLYELLNMNNIPNETVDAVKKQSFAKRLVLEVKKKQKFRDIVKEFTIICRGLHGTEYASC